MVGTGSNRRSAGGNVSDRIGRTPIIERPDLAERLPSDMRDIGARMFMMNGCSIILTRDPPDNLWHISIARRDRDPTWDEIATARYRLLPEVPEMVMHLPPISEYVNLHAHCFHLHELPRPQLIVPIAAIRARASELAP
jgi:hypothetical protein